MRKELQVAAFLLLSCISILNIQCKKEDEQPLIPSPPAAAKPGVVSGTITNEYNQLLSGVLVDLHGPSNKTTITTNGYYLFNSLKPGAYTLSIKKNGYIESTALLSIAAGDTTLKDFILKAGTAYMNLLSDSVIIAKPYTGSFTLKVASNTNWTISHVNNWLTPDKVAGKGDDSTVVRVATWPGDTTRQTELFLHAGSIVKKIIVKQLPDVKLLQTTIIPGNVALGISDSIALVFNQPITIKSLFPGYTFCQSDIRFSYSGNKATFSYACAALGGDYPFTITTNNSIGDQYTFNFSVGFYQKMINISGTIQSSFVNDADNSYWVITDHPNALYKIDMTTFDILHKYDLPNEPTLFTISPYNNKIYLAYRRIPKIFILNQDGTTDQVIDIPHDTTRGISEFNGPVIYPSSIAFAKNGKGMLWLSDINGGYSTYYWFIDAAANHRIWHQSIPGYSSGAFISPRINYDKTKLVTNSINGDPTIGIFDLQQMTFSSYKPAKYDVPGFVTPSRKNANLYVGQLYFQFIINLATGTETPAVNRDNRHDGNVDFLYKPGKDLTVYFTETSSMETIDYATGKTLVKHDAIYNLRGTTATLDGNYIIVNHHNGSYKAKVIQLPTTWFD